MVEFAYSILILKSINVLYIYFQIIKMFKAFKKLLKSMSLLGVLARTGMANNFNCF